MSNNQPEIQNQKDNPSPENQTENSGNDVVDPTPTDAAVSQTTGSDSPPDNSSVAEAPESSAAASSTASDSAQNESAQAETPKPETQVEAATGSASDESTGAEATTSEGDADKPKIRIGSQRDESGTEAVVPRAVKEAQETVVPAAGEQPPKPEQPVGPSIDDLGNQWEKEAQSVLDDQNINQIMDTASADADLDLPISSRVKGTVTRVDTDTVFFLLKGQYDGVLPIRQFKKEPEPGTMTDVVVTGFNSEESLYELALPGAAVAVGDWSDLQVGNLIEVKITGSNTGGLECSVNNIRGFIPASQIDVSRVDNLGGFVNQTMECVITEANKKKKNLVLSRRAILEKELQARKKEILEEFEVGSIIEGKITKLRDFGAFVNIGNGVEGLVHISKCCWHHIKHPSEVFEEGQEVSVRIEKVNKEKGKIQLSHRDTVEHPWKRVSEKYPLDSTIKGTVSKIADFGAFIRLETGVEGLVHISEISHERVKSVGSVLSEGQDVEVKVLSLDPDKQKMSLSMKALLPVPEKEAKPAEEKEPDQPPREMAVKKRNRPLKGGTAKGTGGDQFGLKW